MSPQISKRRGKGKIKNTGARTQKRAKLVSGALPLSSPVLPMRGHSSALHMCQPFRVSSAVTSPDPRRILKQGSWTF